MPRVRIDTVDGAHVFFETARAGRRVRELEERYLGRAPRRASRCAPSTWGPAGAEPAGQVLDTWDVVAVAPTWQPAPGADSVAPVDGGSRCMGTGSSS